MSDKIKVGGIFSRKELCMMQIIGVPHQPGRAAAIFKIFSDRNMSLEFISQSETTKGMGAITVCTSSQFCPLMDEIEVEVTEKIKPGRIKRIPIVEMVTLYGPHFAERHSIATILCQALGSQGINIIGISTSVNSITCVIESKNAKRTREIIHDSFEFPEY